MRLIATWFIYLISFYKQLYNKVIVEEIIKRCISFKFLAKNE